MIPLYLKLAPLNLTFFFCLAEKLQNSRKGIIPSYDFPVFFLSLFSQDSKELKWRSGPVSERLSSTLLMTRSGQLYHLMGPLSRDEMEKESPELNQPTMKKFKRGFPSEWQDLLCKQKPLSV